MDKIKNMYDKLNYFDQYGGSFAVFIIITLMLIIVIFYFHIMINIQPIIDDWSNQRCKPLLMPIAGFITHPEGVTASEYTAQNFTYCSQNILSSITGDALKPLTFVTNALQSVSTDVQNSIQSVRAMFNKIRNSMQQVSEEIMGRIMNVMVSLMQVIISFKDLIGKIQGTMTAGLFTALGGYYALKSLLGVIAQFIVKILITLSVLIAILWIAPFTWGAAMANTVIFAAIAVPMSIILAFMSDTLKINSNYNIPKMKCFDKNTLLKMTDNSFKKIIDIEVGDILSNNNRVTAKIKVATEGSTMYSLHNTIVSDSHIVKHVDTDNWIRVEQHPSAIKCETYSEPYLYCLNTTDKTITCNGVIFTDWDEIYGHTLHKVMNNKEYSLQHTFEIHKYIECGFASSTKIAVKNDLYIDINKIKVNDILEHGEKVYGIVEIDGNTIESQFRYNLGENVCVEGRVVGCVYKKQIPNKNKLYHLLTNEGTFKIENITVKDYNNGIDRILEK